MESESAAMPAILEPEKQKVLYIPFEKVEIDMRPVLDANGNPTGI
jgi:hypothetical protein